MAFINGAISLLQGYWWAFVIAALIVVFAIIARKGILGKRVEELFSWPPQP